MEAAAGLFTAYEVASTVGEVGALTAGGYAVSRPTNQLKAKFSCIATTPGGSSESLSRAYHTATFYDGRLYVFGGLVSIEPAVLAGNEMHILHLDDKNGLIQYHAVPAIGEAELGPVPSSRAGHTATLIGDKIFMYGGHAGGDSQEALQEDGRVWVFNPKTLQWSYSSPANSDYPTLHSHAAVAHENSMVIHGGHVAPSYEASTTTWRYDTLTRMWTMLATIPEASQIVAVAPPIFTGVHDKLYLITGCSTLDSRLHVLSLKEEPPEHDRSWETIAFPTNPLAPGPRPRRGAGITSITMSTGRQYLLLLFGAKTAKSQKASEDAELASDTVSKDDIHAAPFWSEIWSLQLPSSFYTVAAVKDAARLKLGWHSGEMQWAEIEVLPPDVDELSVKDGAHGKVHPGPRAFFACDAKDNRHIVLWGGETADAECLGDGWVVEFQG